MIPKSYTGGKSPTPTQFAKAVIYSEGELRAAHWRLLVEDKAHDVTEKEAAQIDAAVERQTERVRLFLGLD